MPRPGPARIFFAARLLTPDEHAQLQQLADQETGGNLSEMVRRLISEAYKCRKEHKSYD